MLNIKLISAIIFVSIACGGAERVVFCDSVPLQDVDWSENFTLPKFDPNLGTLKEVDIGLEVNLSQQVQMENTGLLNSSMNSTIKSALILLLPDGQEIKANASLAISRSLEAFDGSVDFSGSSGIDFTESSSSGIVSYSIEDISDFIAESPGENVVMKGVTKSMQNSSVSASATSQVWTKAGGSACISYQYEAGAS